MQLVPWGAEEGKLSASESEGRLWESGAAGDVGEDVMKDLASFTVQTQNRRLRDGQSRTGVRVTAYSGSGVHAFRNFHGRLGSVPSTGENFSGPLTASALQCPFQMSAKAHTSGHFGACGAVWGCLRAGSVQGLVVMWSAFLGLP